MKEEELRKIVDSFIEEIEEKVVQIGVKEYERDELNFRNYIYRNVFRYICRKFELPYL